MKDWIYVGIFLEEDSKEVLASYYPVIKDWKPYYDHVTLVFNDGSERAQLIKEFNKANFDKVFYLEAIGVGLSDKALAVKVKLPPGVVCANPVPHITLCVSPNGRPVDSNDIQIWHEIESLDLWGTLKVFTGS